MDADITAFYVLVSIVVGIFLLAAILYVIERIIK